MSIVLLFSIHDVQLQRGAIDYAALSVLHVLERCSSLLLSEEAVT